MMMMLRYLSYRNLAVHEVDSGWTNRRYTKIFLTHSCLARIYLQISDIFAIASNSHCMFESRFVGDTRRDLSVQSRHRIMELNS
jgi:hypothetical protein